MGAGNDMANSNHKKPSKQPDSFDGSALAAIYDEFYPPIYRYIYRQVSDLETARDLTSEVFHRLLQAVQKGNGPRQDTRAWLYRTAHNIVVDHYRRQQHRQHLPLYEHVADDDADPVSEAEDRLAVAKVRQALNHLTPDQRQVISLKFLAGFSNMEVAHVMNKPVGAVKSLQHRALAALQRELLPAKEKVPV
jgi:RNA polymerase sigma-70 factor (ECF subfamily)